MPPSGSSSNVALDRLLRLIALLNRCASVCGMTVFRADFRPDWRVRICRCVIAVYTALTAYTLHYFRHDYARLLQSLCVDGILIAGVHKLLVAQRHSVAFWVPLRTLCRVYEANPEAAANDEDRHRRRRRRRQLLLQRTVAYAWLGTWCVIGTTCFGLALYAMWPVWSLAVRGEREMLMMLVCPGIDWRTPGGWAAMCAWQVAAAAYGVTGNLCFDLYVQVVVCGHRSLVAQLDDGLKELSAAAAAARRKSDGRGRWRERLALRNVLQAFQETDAYIKQLNDLYHSVILSQVASLSASMVLSLFCIVVNKWMGGIGFVILCLGLFLSMSYVGTILQTSNQELCAIIYACDWYLFPIAAQRQILMLLMKTQRSTELWIGPVAPLNVESALAVLKSIYQMFMMMLEFVRD